MDIEKEKYYWKLKLGFDPLPGWEWCKVHEHDLDGWIPTIEYIGPGSHYKFTVKDKETLKQVSRIMRER